MPMSKNLQMFRHSDLGLFDKYGGSRGTASDKLLRIMDGDRVLTLDLGGPASTTALRHHRVLERLSAGLPSEGCGYSFSANGRFLGAVVGDSVLTLDLGGPAPALLRCQRSLGRMNLGWLRLFRVLTSNSGNVIVNLTSRDTNSWPKTHLSDGPNCWIISDKPFGVADLCFLRSGDLDSCVWIPLASAAYVADPLAPERRESETYEAEVRGTALLVREKRPPRLQGLLRALGLRPPARRTYRFGELSLPAR